MLNKIGAMLGIATAASAMASSTLPMGGVDAHYGQLTREEAKATRIAKKKQKAAKAARKRNRRK